MDNINEVQYIKIDDNNKVTFDYMLLFNNLMMLLLTVAAGYLTKKLNVEIEQK